MTSELTPRPQELLQTHPALSILRLAALSAGPDGALDDESLDLMFDQVQTGALKDISPADVWPELVRGLMSKTPSNMLRAMYACDALSEVLPEVAGLFGVPQIADDPPQVDIGHHILRVLDEAARCEAPLSVRFAALVMNVGKSDSPPEHLPIHYRHIERGLPRIEAIAERFGAPDECRDLALIAIAECERVHRVSEIRAGPVALMLERLGAFDNRERFNDLMILCGCDYRAYGVRRTEEYPKATLLGMALHACETINEAELAAGKSETEALDIVREARAMAIATAFQSERWSK